MYATDPAFVTARIKFLNNLFSPHSYDYGVFCARIIVMKYRFRILLNKTEDEWNWFDVSRNQTSYGFCWRDKLSGTYLEFYDKLIELSEKRAKTEIGKFLDETYKKNEVFFSERQKLLEKDFDSKFNNACNWLERTTGRPLFRNDFTIYLTTFPRSPYDPDKGAFWFNIFNKTAGYITFTFLHEALHFQFHHYWQNNKKSSVSKLPPDQFELLKESLTVVIDDDVKPLVPFPDKGYPDHQNFRKILHNYWKKHRNFDKLVEYGLKKLPEYTK